MIEVLLFSIALLLCWFWISKPLREGSQEEGERLKDFYNDLKKYEVFIYERERLLENLVEADLDLKAEKMSAADYEELKAKLLGEAAQVYEKIESLEKQSEFLLKAERDLKLLEVHQKQRG